MEPLVSVFDRQYSPIHLSVCMSYLPPGFGASRIEVLHAIRDLSCQRDRVGVPPSSNKWLDRGEFRRRFQSKAGQADRRSYLLDRFG